MIARVEQLLQNNEVFVADQSAVITAAAA